MGDYKSILHEAIMELQQMAKRGEVLRKDLFWAIDVLTEEYFAKNGEFPDAAALERLADLCLYEEITDSNPDKMTTEEYPIMSDTQLARRREGKHRKKEANYRIEVPLGIAENYGIDGKVHDYPTRRQRSERENSFVDKEARARNKERKHAYNEFTKVQPVVVRKISDINKGVE
jgi:hypothetical protein